jgi:hypothetical protein
MLDLLIKLFGKAYVNKIIGTGTNISKPIKLDKNSPFKLYSDSAFKDSDVLNFIEKKIAEYGPYALSNKNVSEVKNFEMNAQRLLNAKQPKKESTVKSVVESMFGPLGKSDKPTPKPEAEIVDIRTKEKVKPEGIMKLKTELGLPEGVEPGSIADKAIKESVEYKTKQQGVDSVLDENYVPPKSTSLDEDEIADIGARGYSAEIEGKRRAVIRQVLLKDARIDLPEDVRNSLKNYDDLRGGADESMDPLKIFDDYYERDNEILGELDGIIDTAENQFKAADEFLSMEDNFKPKDLGTKLKDYDGDPDGLAEGGRIGYSVGTKLRIAKFFGDKGMDLARELKKAVDDIFPSGDRKLDADVVVDNMLEDLGVDRDMFDQKDISNLYGMAYNTLSEGSVPRGLAGFMTKKGKGKVKMADEIEVSQDVKDKVEFDKQRMEDNFTQEMAPQMYERMQLKIRYPGITDDLIQKIMIDDNPQRKAEVLATLDEAFKMMDKGMSSDEILNTVKNTPRTKNAFGGLNYLMGM